MILRSGKYQVKTQEVEGAYIIHTGVILVDSTIHTFSPGLVNAKT